MKPRQRQYAPHDLCPAAHAIKERVPREVLKLLDVIGQPGEVLSGVFVVVSLIGCVQHRAVSVVADMVVQNPNCTGLHIALQHP